MLVGGCKLFDVRRIGDEYYTYRFRSSVPFGKRIGCPPNFFATYRNYIRVVIVHKIIALYPPIMFYTVKCIVMMYIFQITSGV